MGDSSCVPLPAGRDRSYWRSALKLALTGYGFSLSFALRSETGPTIGATQPRNWIKPMNKTNITDCRRMLEARRAELLSSHHDTEGIAIERVPDSTEEFSLEVQRSMAVDALNRKTALLRQVTEALERIAEGKYGVCLACQEAISPKRLAALPWAALCFQCQQAAENRRRRRRETERGSAAAVQHE